MINTLKFLSIDIFGISNIYFTTAYEYTGDVVVDQVFGMTIIIENSQYSSYVGTVSVSMDEDQYLMGTKSKEITGGSSVVFDDLYITQPGTYQISIEATKSNRITLNITVTEPVTEETRYIILGSERSTYNVDESFTLSASVYLSSSNQVDTDFDGNITLVPSPENLTGTLTEAAVAGVAMFTLSIDAAVEVLITATSTDVNSGDITLTGLETMESIRLVSFPAAAYVGATLATFEAWALNQDGQLFAGFTGDVVLSKVSGDGTLGGTLTKAASGGVAEFDDITLSADGAHVLRVTGNALTDDGSITVLNHTITIASSATVYNIDEVFTVTATVKNGADTVTGYTDDISIAIFSGVSYSGELGGTLTQAAVGGASTFNDLSLDSGGSFRLEVTAADCDPAYIDISINELPPSLLMSGLDQSAAVDGTIGNFTVSALDGAGEVDTSFTGFIKVSILSGTGTLSGTTTAQAVAGVSTFIGLSINTAGSFVLKAEVVAKVLATSYDDEAGATSQDLYVFDQRGQSFTVPVGYGGDLHSAEVLLSNSGGSAGPVVLKVFAVSGDVPTGTAIATAAEIDSSGIATSGEGGTWGIGAFSAGAISESTKYVLVTDYTGKTGTSGLRWYSKDGYTGGTRSYYNGSTWAALSGDQLFRIYIASEGDYEIATGAITVVAPSTPDYVDPDFVGWVMDTIAQDYFADATTIKVTNLNTTGTGSFYAALRTTGKRKIVFEVGGVIDMSSITAHGLPGKVDIASGDVYVVGQTAPSPGIHIIKCMLDIYNANNVFIQHMSFFGSTVANTDCIAPRGDYIVLDHVSTYYGLDENIGPFPYDGVRLGSNIPHHITVSNSIIADSTYTPGGNIAASKGLWCTDKGRYFAFFGNLLINNYYRNPMLKADVQCAIVNNYIYNPGQSAINHAYVSSEWSAAVPPDSLISVVGNYVQCGGDAITGLRIYGGNTTAQGYRGQIYINDNLGFYQNGSAMPQYSTALNDMIVGSAPIWHTSLNTKVAASALQDYIVANVGARPWDRSTRDALKITQMLSGGTQGEVIDTTGISYPSLTPTQQTYADSDWNYNVLPAQKQSSYIPPVAATTYRGIASGAALGTTSTNAYVDDIESWGGNYMYGFMTFNGGSLAKDQVQAAIANIEPRLSHLRDIGMKVTIDLTGSSVYWPGQPDKTTDEFWQYNGAYGTTSSIMAAFWKEMAAQIVSLGYEDVVHAFKIHDEPLNASEYSGSAPNPPSNWHSIAQAITTAVRTESSQIYIGFQPGPGGTNWAYSDLVPLTDPANKILYYVHGYGPLKFTHQGLSGNPIDEPYPYLLADAVPSRTVFEIAYAQTYSGDVWPSSVKDSWDLETTKESVRYVREFQLAYDVEVMTVFSAVRWAPLVGGISTAATFIEDWINMCEEYGWGWNYWLHDFESGRAPFGLKYDEGTAAYIPSGVATQTQYGQRYQKLINGLALNE